MYNLYDHQAKFVEWAMPREFAACLFEVGTGKTLTMIDLWMKRKFKKVLVVSPLSSLTPTWKHEVAKWSYYEPLVLTGTVKARAKVLAKGIDDGTVVIINYDVVAKLGKPLASCGFDCIVLDESTFIKNPKAQRTKFIWRLGDFIPNRYILTGTPAPNGIEDYFGQMRFLSPTILGDNYYSWIKRMFYPTGYGGYKLGITEENQKKILDDIKEHSFTARKKDCLDLPGETDIIRHVHLTKDQRRVYDQMKKDFLLEFESGDVTAEQAAVQLMKLRQIASGFIYNDEGEVIKLYDGKIPDKVKVLDELLDEIGRKEKVIIWVNFKAEGELLSKYLGVDFYSSLGQRKRDQLLEDFQHGSANLIIANPISLGYSVTLTASKADIYYSLSYDSLVYEQSRARIYRAGQERPVTHFHLIAPSTIDEKIYSVLKEKGSVGDMRAEYLKE
jgi:SNF2 family DNA or RNA helicase